VVTINLASVDFQTYLHRQKPYWNAIAILYVFLGYFGGIALLILSNIGLNALGIVVLTYSLIISAYLSHEFMHGNIFKDRRRNTVFGEVMLWLNGGCYYGFKALTIQHIAHHLDRVDVLTFDIAVAMQRQPQLIRQGIAVLEWLYFPIVAFWSRWRFIASPWWNPERRDDQARMAIILVIRFGLFTVLGLTSLKVLLLYFLCYVGMITVLRWTDAFQHTYEAVPPGTPLPKRNSDHEQANTFSTLLSHRYDWLNLLLLNFGYHNAHHAVMRCPWHSLHELNGEFSQNNDSENNCYITLSQQLINYHRFRVARLFAGQGLAVDQPETSTENYYGAVDVSFITLY
jgi:fatty acid desaturase